MDKDSPYLLDGGDGEYYVAGARAKNCVLVLDFQRDLFYLQCRICRPVNKRFYSGQTDPKAQKALSRI